MRLELSSTGVVPSDSRQIPVFHLSGLERELHRKLCEDKTTTTARVRAPLKQKFARAPCYSLFGLAMSNLVDVYAARDDDEEEDGNYSSEGEQQPSGTKRRREAENGNDSNDDGDEDGGELDSSEEEEEDDEEEARKVGLIH